MNKQTKTQAPQAPKPQRVEVFTRKYCDSKGVMHSVGEECKLTDADELAKLTENNALKTIVKKG